MLENILNNIEDVILKSKIISMISKDEFHKINNFLFSSFYARFILEKNPELLLEILTPDENKINIINYKEYLSGKYSEIEKMENPDEIFSKLRIIKNFEIVLIAYKDFNNITSFSDSVLHLSILADFCITYSFKGAFLKCPEKIPFEILKDNIFIIAMGKLGGLELNISSDIDLIFFGKDDFIQFEDNNNFL
jgi:[glutamine synthetase] adenylyltransferase / [glutamine synthetase]-adenylyl-L-tyrosine phosphorylase